MEWNEMMKRKDLRLQMCDQEKRKGKERKKKKKERKKEERKKERKKKERERERKTFQSQNTKSLAFTICLMMSENLHQKPFFGCR